MHQYRDDEDEEKEEETLLNYMYSNENAAVTDSERVRLGVATPRERRGHPSCLSRELPPLRLSPREQSKEENPKDWQVKEESREQSLLPSFLIHLFDNKTEIRIFVRL